MFVLFWRHLAFCFQLPTCGNSQSKTKRFDDRLSLERARHELKKKHSLYSDLHSIPASLYCMDPGFWEEAISCLSDFLHFASRPTWLLVSHFKRFSIDWDAGRQTILFLNAESGVGFVTQIPIIELSASSKRVIPIFQRWVKFIPCQVSMWPKPNFVGESAADACATGNSCQIGGFIRTNDQTQWFSERVFL